MSSRSRSPRSSRGQPSHSRFQNQSRFVERKGQKGSQEGSRNRDTVFQSIESRDENKRPRDRLLEIAKMQGDASSKTAEQIQMEKMMGFGSFQEPSEKYFD